MNSYTFFKNQWFQEGMARASESFFRTSTAQSAVLPQTSAQLDSLLAKSYDAETLWSRLTNLCGNSVWGIALENFSRLDRQAALARNLDPNDWPEDEQFSAANVPYLLKGISEAVQKSCPTQSNPEVRQFLSVIKSRTNDLQTNRSPGLSDYAGFSSLVTQAGGRSVVQADGRIEVSLNGVTYFGWPGWDVSNCQLRGLYNVSPQVLGYGNGNVCQTIYPAPADPIVLKTILASLDPLGELQFEENGRLKISFNGTHVTLLPSYSLSDVTQDSLSRSYWLEETGAVKIVFPDLGKLQEFNQQY
jgi:hypothetical protein